MDAIKLKEDIANQLKKYDDRKDLSRGFAIGIKLITAILGAIVTVLLGWRFEGDPPLVLSNLALICGAIIAVMNTIDTFWSFSAKWANYKAVCTELIFLQMEVQKEKDLNQDKIDFYDQRLQQIIKDAEKASLELHKQTK